MTEIIITYFRFVYTSLSQPGISLSVPCGITFFNELFLMNDYIFKVIKAILNVGIITSAMMESFLFTAASNSILNDKAKSVSFLMKRF